MSTEKIVNDAAEQIASEQSEQLAAAQEALAREQAEAEQLAQDLAKAAIEGERGKVIENLQRELSECRNEIQNLTTQVTALLAAQANSRPPPISEQTPKPPADLPPPAAPVIEPDKTDPPEPAKKPDASADHTKSGRKPAKWF